MKLIIITTLNLLLAGINSFSQTTIRKIKPSDTDPTISTFNVDSNYIYLNTSSIAKNTLVVYLPGSNSEPKHTEYFGTLASDLGFHSIGLMYPNVPPVATMCANSSDPFCHENVRKEIIEGFDYSTLISIGSSECILNRLKKLLIYLNNNYTSEDWGQYLDVNQNLIFPKIIFAGGSQGGGHALIIGKYFQTKRIVCFSSPKDYSIYFNAPPIWYSSENWHTPKSEIYSFNHTLDYYSIQLEIFDSLGLDDYGLPINVDNTITPYNTTRQLFTSYPVPSGDEHACTVNDNKTPKNSGIPVFVPVWTYMLTHNLNNGISNIIYEQNIKINLKPNPTNDFVYFELTDDKYLIKIYDRIGKIVFEHKAPSGNIQIDLSNFNSGLYFIQAHSAKRLFTGKIVKE